MRRVLGAERADHTADSGFGKTEIFFAQAGQIF
jgi:hypothetical protein